MNIILFVLIWAVIIAIGIALAPYILPIIGVGAIILAGVAALLFIAWLTRIFFSHCVYALAESLAKLQSIRKYQTDIAVTAWKMIFVGRLPQESNTFLRRALGAGILSIYALLLAISLFVLYRLSASEFRGKSYKM